MNSRFLRKCLLMVPLVSALALSSYASQPSQQNNHDDFPYLEATVAQLEAAMQQGKISSEQLTRAYIQRILELDQNGPNVNAVIELNPDALEMARYADKLRKQHVILGPMHGIPVLLKDNVDTGDKMQTSAGSFALVGQPALQDSTVAQKLRSGGAVILGKTNLSEWANFRSFESISGWSGRGGQTNNPYGIARNPCGSSSGSAASASANFVTVSFGTETDGSIVCPANASGVVGLKPTVGVTSRAGIVPISHTQDTFGIHGRYVADAAVALGVVQSRTYDGRDPATGGVPLGWQCRQRPNIPADYTQFLNAHGLQGARIGVVRSALNSFDPNFPTPAGVYAAFDAAVKAMQDAGATIVDLDAQNFTFPSADGETLVLCYEFKHDVAKYFATRKGVPVAGGTLADAIAFNIAHADVEMPYFTQDIFDLSNSLLEGDDTPQPAFNGMTYNQALADDKSAGNNGLDLALSQFNLDAVMSATDNPAWSTDLIYGDHFLFGTSGLAAPVGYPIVQVPAGEVFGTPVGISFFGTAFSEPMLIKLASGYEAVTQMRKHNLPTFHRTVPFDHIDGTTLKGRKNVTVPPATNSNQSQPADNAPVSPKDKKPLRHL